MRVADPPGFVEVYDPQLTTYGLVPQEGNWTFPVTGSDSPANSAQWDVVNPSGVVIANNTTPNGWSVSPIGKGAQKIMVSTPASAPLASGYEARAFTVAYGGFNLSAFFGVIAPGSGATTAQSAPGTKNIVEANGSRISFSAPAVPTAAQPQVACPVAAGEPLLVEWDYDPTVPAGHFVITMSNRTKWLMSSPSAATFCYSLGQIVDRNGNAIDFVYGAPDTITTNVTTPYSDHFPLLSRITDHSTGSALLTINRATDGTGNITSVSDCYGRSVYYHASTYSTQNVPSDWAQSYQEVDHVSQLVPTGTSNPPDRWAYGYQSVGNGEGSETVPFLHTITVPSPTGTGSQSASINYNSATDLVSSLVDANGNTIAFTSSDAAGNPSYPSNYTKVIYSDSGGHQAYSSIIGFDSNMSETSATDGAGNVISSKSFSDPNDPYRPSSVTDGNGKVTQYVWDQYGNLLTETPPANANRTPATTTYTYSYTSFALGELLSQQEGSKAATSYTYFEPSGLVHTVQEPLPGSPGTANSTPTSYTYDGLGNVLTVTVPGNNAVANITTTLNYTTDGSFSQPAAIGQPLTVTDNLGKVTHIRYDARANAVSIVDALGDEADDTYNIADQSLQTTFPATGQQGSGHSNSLKAYLYPGGPMTGVTFSDESGTAIRQVNYAYGNEGETLGVSGSTEPVIYTYDAQYRLATLTDGNGNATHYYYKQQGYLDAVTYPGYTGPAPIYNAATDDYSNVTGKDSLRFPSYDADGNLLTRLDGNGVTTTYTHSADPESLLTNIHYAYPQGYTGGTTGDVSFAYDAYGRRGSMMDGTGTQSDTYDDLDNTLSVTTAYTGLPVQMVTYGYWPDSSRQSMGTPAGSFSYTYDADGRMTGLTNPYNEASAWSYRDNGWLATQSDTGIFTGYNQTAQGALQSETNSLINANGSALFSSVRDGVGNVTRVTSNLSAAPASYSGVTNYQYDTRNQLTQEQSQRAGGYTNAFAYDGGTSTGPGNPTTFRGASRAFNADNQDAANAYDGDGNPTLYNGQSLSFDPENRLTAFGTAETNGYMGDGLRAWKQGASGRTYFLYDGTQSVCELDGTGTVTATNTFGANGLLSRHTGAGSAFYAFDLSGNVAQRADAGGNSLSADMYDGFGQRTGTSNSPDMFGFGGQWGGYTDAETGLVLCTHRYYDPVAGRFLNRDPAHYYGGINLYGYTENNPVNWRDPNGTSLESDLAEAKALDGDTSDSSGSSTFSGYAGSAASSDPDCRKMGYIIHRLCDDKFPPTGDHCKDLGLDAKRAVGCCLARILRDRKCGGWDDPGHKTVRDNQCKNADKKVKQYQQECVPCKS